MRITGNSAPLMMSVDSLELYGRARKRSIKARVVACLRRLFSNKTEKQSENNIVSKTVQFQSKCQSCGKWRHGTIHSHNYCCIDLTLFPWVSVDEGREWNPVGPYDPC